MGAEKRILLFFLSATVRSLMSLFWSFADVMFQV